MRTSGLFVLILVISLALSASCKVSESKERSDGGGSKCAACTVVFQLVFNLMVVDNTTFDAALINLCTILPEPYSTPCILFAEEFGAELLILVGEGASSDNICQALGICTNQTCRLFPEQGLDYKYVTSKNLSNSMSVWQWLYDIIFRFANEHLPLADFDGDKFSAAFDTLRGSDWRGQDCNGFNNEIYPGRQSSNFPPTIDHDCNGISGRDHLGRSYEDLLCGESDRRGYIGLGDSATAHFRIPPQYLNASEITRTTYDHLLFILENELDWPHRSWGTGHLNDTTGDCSGPLDSIYLNLYNRNRCNFKDYQNIGVNGARTGSMAPPGIVDSMARNQTQDHPALVFYALVGNDVCHGQPSFDVMTTPPEFKQNVLNALDYINSTVPPGSFVINRKEKVVFIGLAEGEILWNTMWNRTHPIGCTYEDVYDFLNCLQISPCWGWLNSDAEVRARTGLRARELSLVYPDIVANYKYANFEMAYYPFPLPKAIEFWTSHGGQVYELIEPVDGFHPSQQANAVLAQVLVDEILQDHPEFLGAINPNNEQIKSLFGNQGGY